MFAPCSQTSVVVGVGLGLGRAVFRGQFGHISDQSPSLAIQPTWKDCKNNMQTVRQSKVGGLDGTSARRKRERPEKRRLTFDTSVCRPFLGLLWSIWGSQASWLFQRLTGPRGKTGLRLRFSKALHFDPARFPLTLMTASTLWTSKQRRVRSMFRAVEIYLCFMT